MSKPPILHRLLLDFSSDSEPGLKDRITEVVQQIVSGGLFRRLEYRVLIFYFSFRELDVWHGYRRPCIIITLNPFESSPRGGPRYHSSGREALLRYHALTERVARDSPGVAANIA